VVVVIVAARHKLRALPEVVAIPRREASLSHAIVDIVRLTTQKKVVRTHASGSVAAMQHEPATRIFPGVEEVRQPVDQHVSSVASWPDTDVSVSGWGQVTRPNPALCFCASLDEQPVFFDGPYRNGWKRFTISCSHSASSEKVGSVRVGGRCNTPLGSIHYATEGGANWMR
jgi:hypothetical protein